MPNRWLAPAITLLMGCCVGGYSIGTPLPTVAGVVASALALALPVIISVLVDPTLSNRGLVVTGLVTTSLLLGGLLIGTAAFPSVWQGYSSDAVGFSVLAEMLLAPFVAAFVVTPLNTGSASGVWNARAIAYGLLAWAGIGFQSTVLTYVIPVMRTIIAVFIFHQSLPRDSGGFTYGWAFDLIFIFVLIALYLVGFGYAVLLGLMGGALRSRLKRHPQHSAIPLGGDSMYYTQLDIRKRRP